MVAIGRSAWRVVTGLLLAAGLLGGAASAQAVVEKPATVTVTMTVNAGIAASPELQATIGREMEATVKAFNAGDAEGIANLFLDRGELIDENGNLFTGKTEIAALFKAFFEKFPRSRLEMEVTAVRSIGDSLAVEEGIRRITSDEAAVAAQLRYVAVRDRTGDRWPIASYREFADDPMPTPQEMLQPLAFLVGDWVDESPESRTSISYRWSEDGNFLIGDYVLASAGSPESKSTQRIGWDPVEGTIRSWTFDADGGFSQGEWTQLDDGWVAKSEATMPDGTTASATVILTPRDEDHFSVRSTDRIVAGGEEPDFELVIARKPPQPAGDK